MTMSRKSIESSSICSRRRTFGARPDRSSSGAMVWMMSLMARTMSSWVIGIEGGESGTGGDSRFVPAHDDGRVDAEHSEGEVEDVAHGADALGLAEHQTAHLALGIE